MQRQAGGIPAFVLVLVAVVIFGVMLYLNAKPAPALTVIVPTQGAPTQAQDGWEQVHSFLRVAKKIKRITTRLRQATTHLQNHLSTM